MAVDPAKGPEEGWTWADTPQEPFVSAAGQPMATASHPLTEGDQSPPSGVGALVRSDLMQSAAHPQTLSDIGHLLLAPTDATRGAIANLPTVVKAAGDIVSGVKQQAGNVLMHVAHPVDTLDRIAKHLIGSESPDPIELEAAKNELAAVRLRLQAARSVTRQTGAINSMPVSDDVVDQAKNMVQVINRSTSQSPIVDASGRVQSAAHTLSDWDSKFISGISERLKGGGTINANQVSQLQRIYQSVAKSAPGSLAGARQ